MPARISSASDNARCGCARLELLVLLRRDEDLLAHHLVHGISLLHISYVYIVRPSRPRMQIVVTHRARLRIVRAATLEPRVASHAEESRQAGRIEGGQGPARPAADRVVPGPDPGAAAVLGRAGLRDPAALRHGGGRRHLPPGHHLARARPQALERGLRAALAPAQGRALRREPQPAAALLPVPGDHEAVAGGLPGPLPGEPGAHRHRPDGARHPLRRGRLGEPDAWAPGGSAGRCGATAWR